MQVLFTKRFGIAVRLKESNTLLKQLSSKGSTIKPDEFFYDATNGVVVLNAVHSDKEFVLNYKRDEVVDMVDLLVDEVLPDLCHSPRYIPAKDGTFAGVETELYMCRAKGTFSINAQRAAASVSAISLQILDPERPDGKIGSIKRFSAKSKI